MNENSITTAAEMIDHFLSQGRYTFTQKEAVQWLQRTPGAVSIALYRLAKKKRLMVPKSGFYVIVDPQHRSRGTMPPEWFVHDLMDFMKKPYYVGVLSAAQIHGAAHHRPQEFQIVTHRPTIRPILINTLRIRFFSKATFSAATVEDVKTPTGMMRISTPEQTAWDLIRYQKSAGGLDNVATLLSELAEQLDAKKLATVASQNQETAVTQRLGYILDFLDQSELTEPLARNIRRAPLRMLDPSAGWLKGAVDNKWRLVVNSTVEAEI